MRRIHEQQQDIKSQSTQIDALTNQFQQQLQLADVVQNGMTTVHALVEASEHRQKSVLDEAITKHHIITTRKLNEINSTFHLELNKLTRSVADLNIQINEIRSLVSK